MTPATPRRDHTTLLALATLFAFAVSVLALQQVAGTRLPPILLGGTLLVAALHRTLLRWRNLLAGLLLVILYMPIGRYSLPGHLPFALEPYRVFVALILLFWISSLLIDRRVTLRLGAAGGPLLVVLAVTLASMIANPSRVHAVGSIAIKRMTFFASYVFVFFLVVSLVRRARDIDFLVRVTVAAGGVLGFFSLIEYTTGYNVFNHLSTVIPLETDALPYSLGRRGERLRVIGSSQHPIALGALFVMLLPLTAYVWSSTRQRRWILSGALLLLGTLTTQSRTAIVMLFVVLIVLLRLRPHAIKRLWPLVVPALLVVHLAVPGAIGSLKGAFFPKGGVVAQQESGAGTYGSGRLADIGPSLAEFSRHPVVGEGYGTRVTDRGPLQNASILDDQWLSTLLEIGLFGVIAWIWTWGHVIRRLMRAAREDDTSRGWLCAGLAAGIFAYAVGMFTYDAFSFVQVTVYMFVLLGIASAVLEVTPETWRREMVMRG